MDKNEKDCGGAQHAGDAGNWYGAYQAALKENNTLRQQLATARDALKGKSDHAYCRYIQTMQADACLGWEYKVRSGRFSKENLDGFMSASEWLGKHRAFSEALAAIGEAQPAKCQKCKGSGIVPIGDGYSVNPCPSCSQPANVAEELALKPEVRAALLFALWHHQGGSSKVGQPIRKMLGIGPHDHLTQEQLFQAKSVGSQPASAEVKPIPGDVRHCLEKISEFCPPDPTADQLGESVEMQRRLHIAEIGDTARAALLMLSAAPPPTQQPRQESEIAAEALEEAAEYFEKQHPWMSNVSASRILRSHAAQKREAGK